MSIPVIDTLASVGDFPVVSAHDVSQDGTRLDTILASKSDKTTTDAAIALKVDKVSGKSLSDNNFSNADVAKLGGIETGANKTITDTTLNATSNNPIANKTVTAEINKFNSWFTLK